MKNILLTLLLFTCSLGSLLAQNPVTWTWEAKHINGREYEITFKAKIQDGWYTYSQFIGDNGPVPTSINFESTNQEKAGKPTETTSSSSYRVEGFDKMFDMNVIKYKKNLTLKQRIKVADITGLVEGYMTYMTCDDTRCMPPTDVEFSFVPSSLKQAGTVETPPIVEPTDQGSIDKPEQKPSGDKLAIQPTTDATVEAAPPTDNTNGLPANPVQWDIKFEQINEQEVNMTATATIADGWYVYSQTLESEDGPLATIIETNEGVEVVSEEELPSKAGNKVAGFDKIFEMDVVKYKHGFVINKRLKVQPDSGRIAGFLEYMTCNATSCMPPTLVEYEFIFAGKENTVATTAPAKSTVQGDIFDPLRPTLAATNLKPYGNCDGETGDTINNNDNQVQGMSWWAIFLAGFGGGLIALLTPCVFPMIPMTVSLFSKGKDAKKGDGIKNALIFGASIIVIYVALGLSITAAFDSNTLNELSTNWIMNVAFFLLFTIFAISFFGYFDIRLPSSWANKANTASMKGGLVGNFFGAFAISLVSFSCTGPIIGTLLVQTAVSGNLAGPAIGMFGFALALALPFTLFAAFPSWLQSLPSSGGWMTTMKVILGFIELALGLKFLSAADLTQHWWILPYELFIVLWGLIFIAMGLYLFGIIHFPHDHKGAKISLPRKGLAVASLAFAVYVFLGFSANKDDTFITPNLLSGLAPPVCYSYLKPCDCPASLIECFKDYDEALAYAKKVNKPLLIDFTGYGCVNCRKMEDQVWTVESVNDIIRDKYVLVSLYVDDREDLPKTLISTNGKKIRNVGNKWAAFQEVNFLEQSQPQYVLVNTKEEVLNTPTYYTPDVEEYQGFLECGLVQFEKSMQE